MPSLASRHLSSRDVHLVLPILEIENGYIQVPGSQVSTGIGRRLSPLAFFVWPPRLASCQLPDFPDIHRSKGLVSWI